MTQQIKAIFSSSKGFFAILLSLAMLFGIISPQSTDSKFEFKDEENLKLSFAAISDTHMKNNAFQPYYFQRLFDDIGNCEIDLDALLIAGDLANSGKKNQYNALFDVLDSQTNFDKILLTMGNHDARSNFTTNKDIIMNKVSQYLGIDTDGRSYYSYDINGCTFIMLCTESQKEYVRAAISDEQLSFLDSELARAAENGNPTFVVCHQPLKNTHGLPAAFINGDIGDSSDKVKDIVTKYKNVFFISGHLHDGAYEKSFEALSQENGVYAVNLPAYGEDNGEGEYRSSGIGYIVEIYENEVVFTLRNFKDGTPTSFVKTLSVVPGLANTLDIAA